jgi:predicted ferric reductase
MPRYVGEIVTASVIALVALCIVAYSAGLPSGAGFFPQFAAICTILLSVYWAATAFIGRHEASRGGSVDFTPTYERLKPLIVAVATVAYVLLMFVLGFFVTTALFVIAVGLILGIRNWRLTAMTLLVTIPLIYLFFVTFLGARLPAGYGI